MTADELLAKLEQQVRDSEVGIELWLSTQEYKRVVVEEGKSFVDWFADVADAPF